MISSISDDNVPPGIRYFDSFIAGAPIGQTAIAIDDILLEEWYHLFPGARDAGPSLPAGLLVAIMMRGYMRIMPDRPAGNVHASLELLWGTAATAGMTVTVDMRCVAKELRNGRRWLTFASTVKGRGASPYLTGTMVFLWAS